MVPQKKEPIVWYAHEYVHREKSSDWYWAVSITAVSIATASILFNNVLFAILIVLAFLILMTYSKREPSVLEVKIDDRGLTNGPSHYHYSTLESFWVEDRFGNTKLIVKSKQRIMPYIIIPVVDIDPDEIRGHMKRHLKEKEHHEPIPRQIMEYLGF